MSEKRSFASTKRTRTKKHKCRRDDVCCCNSMALEPDENCPVHGHGEWPLRCVDCGRFMKVSHCYTCGVKLPMHNGLCMEGVRPAPFGAEV